jgi:hypothetical protein
MAHLGVVYERVKEFKFRVEVNGFPVALVEEFDPGERSIAIVESNGAGQNHPVKEAGMLKYGNAVLRNVIPTEGNGTIFWERAMNMAQNPATNNGLPPSGYWFNFTMYELNNEGNPVRATEFYQGFVSNYKMGNRSALTEDKNAIEEVEIAYVDRETRDI